MPVTIFDAHKLDELIEESNFVRKMLVPLDGYWLIKENRTEKRVDIKTRRIRYKILS